MLTGKRLVVLTIRAMLRLIGCSWPGEDRQTLVPPRPAVCMWNTPLSIDFGEVRLIGYDFTNSAMTGATWYFHPGEQGHLTLYWEAKQKPGRDYHVSVQVLDKSGAAVAAKENTPAGGRSDLSSGKPVTSSGPVQASYERRSRTIHARYRA